MRAGLAFQDLASVLISLFEGTKFGALIIAGNEAGKGVTLVVNNLLEFIIRINAGGVFTDYKFNYSFIDFVFFGKLVFVVD